MEYYLKSTNDKTDRTAEILDCLQKYGVCRLGVGDFYIKNLYMPKNSTLAGDGNATRIFLDESVFEGYAIRLNSYCTVKDFYLSGSSELLEPRESLGGRHGILWKGNYREDKSDFPVRGTVENLYINNFSGGGITHYDTGYSIMSGINVSNCQIWNCGAGINIEYWSEFNRYTNVNSIHNYYGLINNGGNNVFLNCGFSGNTMGVLMDNTNNQSPNNSHGDMIGCTIDHSGKNEGTGVKIINMHNGFQFSACQMMYSGIEIIDSEGILFTGMNFRDEFIKIKGGGIVLFTDCMAKLPPKLTLEDANVKFINCYTRDGKEINPS